MAANGISTLATKELRQKAKLDLVALKRQGFTLNADGTVADEVVDTLTTTSAASYSDGATMNTFRVLNRGGNWDEFFANWTNGTWSCVQFPGSVVTNMVNPGDDSPEITITGGTFVTGTFYTFTGDVLTAGTANTSAPFYRERKYVDFTQLPTQYDDDVIVDNENAGGLVEGRPWVETDPTPPFALTEVVNIEGASIIETNVGPLTIEAKATSYQVNPIEDGYIIVNGTTIKTTALGSRGHTLAVISPAGATVGSITTYDTFESAPGDAGAAGRTALTAALNAVATGNYIVMVSWDACSFDATLRTALNTGYGTTLTTTWASTRYSHIVIAKKI